VKTKIFILLLPLLSFTSGNYDFQKVINKSQSKIIKSKLIKYESNGIEKTLIGAKKIKVDSFIDIAKSYLGTQYRMGGLSHKGIDCSGLFYMSFQKLHIKFPRIAHEQGRFGKIIPNIEELIKGDLIYFQGTYNSTRLITHTGIYIGKGKFLHSTSSYGVTISNLEKSDYWSSKFIFGTRNFINNDKTIIIESPENNE
jgi:murein DD-endopeptidase / murein LD-carboxypeptidase